MLHCIPYLVLNPQCMIVYTPAIGIMLYATTVLVVVLQLLKVHVWRKCKQQLIQVMHVSPTTYHSMRDMTT